MAADNIARRSLGALSWVGLGALGKVFGQLLVQISLARILGPEAFGLFAILISIHAIGFILADFGMGSFLVQKKEISPSDVNVALGWTILLSTLLGVGVGISANSLAIEFGNESLKSMLWVIGILIPAMAVRNIAANLLRRDLRYKGLQIIDVVAYFFFFGGVAIPLAILGHGAWSLVVGFSAQTAFSLVATYLLCKHPFQPMLRGDKEAISFGFKAMTNDLTAWATDNVDRFLIGKFWGLYSLGLYSVAANLTRAPLALIIPATQGIAFASAARLQENGEQIRRGAKLALSAVALITLPVFSLVALESFAILQAIYGEKWLKASSTMSAIAIGMPFVSIGAVFGGILRGIGAVGIELVGQVFTGVLLCIGLTFASDQAVEMAGWTVTIAFVFRCLFLSGALKRKLKLSLYELIESVRGPCLLTACGILAASLMRSQFPGSQLFWYSLVPLFSGLVAISLVIVLRPSWFLGPSLLEVIRGRLETGRCDTLLRLIFRE